MEPWPQPSKRATQPRRTAALVAVLSVLVLGTTLLASCGKEIAGHPTAQEGAASSTTTAKSTSTSKTSTGKTTTPPTSTRAGVAIPKEFVANDGKSKISAPNSWVASAVPTEGYTLDIEDTITSNYILASPDSRRDYDGFSAFTRYIRSWLDTPESWDETRVGDPRELTINGRAAVQWEVVTKNNGVNGVAWCTVVDGAQSYYTVIGGATASEAEAQRALLMQMIETFQEVG